MVEVIHHLASNQKGQKEEGRERRGLISIWVFFLLSQNCSVLYLTQVSHTLTHTALNTLTHYWCYSIPCCPSRSSIITVAAGDPTGLPDPDNPTQTITDSIPGGGLDYVDNTGGLSSTGRGERVKATVKEIRAVLKQKYSSNHPYHTKIDGLSETNFQQL